MISVNVAGIIAGVLNLLGYIVYLWAIFTNNQRPDKVSWWVWAALGAVAFFATWNGEWKAILLLLLESGLIPLLIAFFALKYGEKVKWTWYDVTAISICISSFFVWYITKKPESALILALTIDAYGLGRTLKKCWNDPGSEYLSAWVIFTLANFVNLFAIKNLNFLESGYTIYYFIFCISIVVVVWWRKAILLNKKPGIA